MQGLQIILTPFVWVLNFFYRITNSYGLALILFAILIKIVLFPISLKGKRGMIQMNLMNEKVKKLEKQYGGDKAKYNEKVQELYAKEKVNPMGGCFWSFVPIFFLWPLYAIVRQPLTYMMNMNPETIKKVSEIVNWSSEALSHGWIRESANMAFVNQGYNQMHLASLINESNVAAVRAAAPKAFALNFNFLGINLANIPQWNPAKWGGFKWGAIGLFLLPVISAVSGYVFSKISMKTNAINQASAENDNATSKTMLLMSPIMALWIGFVMPAGLSIYWITQNIVSMGQEVLAGRILKKDYEKAAAERERIAREEKEEEKRRREEQRVERARRIEEAKQNKKKAAEKKETDPDKIPGALKSASRVGIRAYARGRNYDPYRFSPDGPTPYIDYAAKVDEEAVEKALAEREKAAEMAELAKLGITEEDLKDDAPAVETVAEVIPEAAPEIAPEAAPEAEDEPEL